MHLAAPGLLCDAFISLLVTGVTRIVTGSTLRQSRQTRDLPCDAFASLLSSGVTLIGAVSTLRHPFVSPVWPSIYFFLDPTLALFLRLTEVSSTLAHTLSSLRREYTANTHNQSNGGQRKHEESHDDCDEQQREKGL